MFRWKTRTGVAAVAAVALAGFSITGLSASAQAATGSSGSLAMGILTAQTTWSAADASWANWSPYEQAVYDTLLHANPNGKIVPWLAKSWSYNTDKTVLTMKLRTDVTFTDGTAFTADVAAQNLTRFKNGASPNKAFLTNMSSAKAVDPSTLEIDLTAPDPSLLTYLTENAGLMESAAAFTSSTLATVPVGSGPYVLDTKDTVVGSSYVFTKNPNYFAKSQQHYSKITMNVYSSGTAILNAIRRGQIQVSNTYDNTTVAQIKAAGYSIAALQLNWDGFLLMDRGGTQDKALGSVKVRQAINYAFDKKALLSAVGQGLGTVTSSIFPTNSPGYSKSLDNYYSYNVKKAKALMKSAGYAKGFTLSMPSSSYFGTTVYTLISQELKAIGITVKFTDPGANLIADVLAPKWSSAYFTLQEDPTAWQISNFVLLPTATFNPYKYDDSTVVALTKTIQTGSTAEANAATKKLNAYIVKQAWFAPWYRQQSSIAVGPKTKVTVQTGNAYPYLWNIQSK